MTINDPATISYYDDLAPPLDQLNGWEKLTQGQQNKMRRLEQDAYDKIMKLLLERGEKMEDPQIYARRCARMYEVRFAIMKILAEGT